MNAKDGYELTAEDYMRHEEEEALKSRRTLDEYLATVRNEFELYSHEYTKRGWRGKLYDGDVAHIVEYLQEHTNIHTIHIEGFPLSSDDMIELSRLIQRNNTVLRNLGILDCKIGDKEALILAGALENCSQLETLELDSNNIADAGATALAGALKHCLELKAILFDRNHIKDTGAQALVELLHQDITLDLSSNKITSRALHTFINARKTQTFQVCLRHNPVYLEYPLECDKLIYGTQEWKEAKLILLGNGQIGKTTLLRNLTNLLQKTTSPLDQSDPGSTVGMGHSTLEFGGGNVTIFDFAGQLEYTVTHQFFLSSTMTFYLLCYDLSRPPAEQHQQIFYWMEYLNSLLQHKHSLFQAPSFKIFLVGLRADMSSVPPQKINNINSWKQRAPNLVIHPETFQLSSHTDLPSLGLLANKLDEQFNILFESHGKQVLQDYKMMYHNEYINKIKIFNYISEADHYFHAIGKIVLVGDQSFAPSEISSILARFISPESIRDCLLVRDHGASASLLTENEVGVILEINNHENKLQESLDLMCEIGICYAIQANKEIKRSLQQQQYLFPSLGTKVVLRFAKLPRKVVGVRFTAGVHSLIFVPGFFCQLIVQLCTHLKVGVNGALICIPANDGQLIVQIADDFRSIIFAEMTDNQHNLESIIQMFGSFIQKSFPQYKECIPERICPTCLSDFQRDSTYSLFTTGVFIDEDQQTAYCTHENNHPIVRHTKPQLELDIPIEDLDQLTDQLGKGGFGDVYLSKWNGPGGGQEVAVKQICTSRQSDVEKVLDEVHTMATLRHDNICSVFGGCAVGESLVQIVLEYVPGGDLSRYLVKFDPLPQTTQINFCISAARAVNYLHSKNPPILHRDIKSQNFLVVDDKKLKLTDFGNAKIRSMAKYTPSTENWSAPEVLGFSPQWTEKADIYSLGMVFYEIVAKEIPFHDIPEGVSLPQAICNGTRPTIPAGTMSGLVEVIQCCWRQDPSKRPTAKEVLSNLSRLESSID